MIAHQYVVRAALRAGQTVVAPMLAVVVALAASPTVAATIIVDGKGFEAPDFTTTFNGSGQLEGQTPGAFNGTWLRTKGPGAGTANVQNSIVDDGSQAVVVNRAANNDDRWGVPVSGYPSQRYVCIHWTMNVEQTNGPTGTFGPFFGVEAYDDDATSIGLLASLGVDATTGDVLYQIQDTGFFTETGATVAFNQWNDFQIQLDYFTHTATFALNNAIVGTTGFVDHNNIPGGLNEFTDANISAIAAAGDPASQALVGTAYFDNFTVVEDSVPCLVPEPATWALALGLTAVGIRRRNVRK